MPFQLWNDIIYSKVISTSGVTAILNISTLALSFYSRP